MATAILLVHGFTGSPDNFGDLPALLSERFCASSVCVVRLPGHGDGEPPRFDAAGLCAEIREAASRFIDRGDDLVVIGHSTGGTLALAALDGMLAALRLLVLVAVPKRIDGGYLARWNNHRAAPPITLTTLASLVRFVNRLQVSIPADACPVLLLQGEEDELVPPSELRLWSEAIGAPSRAVLAPDCGHHPFSGSGAPFVLDLLLRAISDLAPPAEDAQETLKRLVEVEPRADFFFERNPGALRHLAASPAGTALGSRPLSLSERAEGEPIFLNVEVTTRCDLRCASCARTGSGAVDRDMPVETFRRILDLAPHAYRVTLVGLGEPLMHPDIVALVREGASQGRRVSLVTNAMGLTAELGSDLIEAGLDGITFSLDGVSQDVANRVRQGSDLELILSNIRAFAELPDPGRKVSRAVFTAVSTETLPHLEELLRTVATLKVDAVMLSDLNFPFNRARSLHGAKGTAASAILRQTVRTAFSLGLPVLSVHGLEELGLPNRYHRHLLGNPSRLAERPAERTHCVSPWQTLPVAVDGTVTVCDCQPENGVGNLLRDPFDTIWQGPGMTAQRKAMLTGSAPECCLSCPRF